MREIRPRSLLGIVVIDEREMLWMRAWLFSFCVSQVEEIACPFADECDATPTMQDLELFLTGEQYDAFIEFSVISSVGFHVIAAARPSRARNTHRKFSPSHRVDLAYCRTPTPCCVWNALISPV
jgi:hypothetical protein